MNVHEQADGVVILGDFLDPLVQSEIRRRVPAGLPLVIADPPYGNIVSDHWDRTTLTDDDFATWMLRWTGDCAAMSLQGAALYAWGGIGTPRFRPFYKFAGRVETETPYLIANHITWSKKRAYGVQHNYLFTREELLYMVKGDDIKKPRLFNVPLLTTKRGYAGYNAKYPAKSEFFRRTNVWTDITELFRGKIHTAQKPERLHEVIIETHTAPGEWVLDPFAGSGTTGRAARTLGRKFILVENDPKTFELCLRSLQA